MSALKRLGVRSVVLTSGTLSPMGSFAHELGYRSRFGSRTTHVVANGAGVRRGGSRGRGGKTAEQLV